MRLVFPTIPSTFSVSTSFFAREAIWPGSVCSVSIAPSLIGSSVAFFPVPSPHLDAFTVALPPPKLPLSSSSPPHAATKSERPAARVTSATSHRRRARPSLILTILLLWRLCRAALGRPTAARWSQAGAELTHRLATRQIV